MKTKFNGILTLLLAFVVQFTFAQEKVVSGVVTDDMGPIADITVVVKGTTKGTVTDFDGKYSIKAKKGDTLVFSHISYATVEKIVGDSSVIDVLMKPSGEQLDEIIVVAYGSKTKDEMTSAVSVVSGDELANMSPSTSIDNMLQGKASGVNVTALNGKPGETAYVRIRGIGSINASSAPLFVIDGVVAPDMSSINPDDVESISVLKDAATSSLYGSRAANGVVVITTKKGKKNQKAVITIKSSYGFGRKTPDNFKMMNASQKLQYEAEMAALGVTNAFSLPGATVSNQNDYNYLLSLNHDWQNTLLRKSLVQSNALSFTGGTEKTNYFFNVAHDRNTGIIKQLNGFEKISGRLNLGFQANDWLHIDTNLSLVSTSSDEPRDRNNVQNPFRAMYDYNPYEPLYETDSDGNIILDENGEPIYNLTTSGFSISEALKNNPEVVKKNYLIGGVVTNMKLSDNVTNMFKVGASGTMQRREYYMKPGSVLDGYVGDATNPGSKTDSGYFDFDYTVTNILSYHKSIDKHTFKLSGLFEFNKDTFRNYSLSSIGFSNPDLSVQSIAAQPTDASTNLYESTLLSYGSFLDYNFDGKYVATASIRRDGSSVFGENNRFGVFWSASAAWNIHNENFMEDGFFNELKLRASYGTSGNRAGIGRYASLPILAIGSFNGQSTIFPTDGGNPNLKWEKQKTFDVGLEFSFLNKKISGVIDYFNKTSTDLLLNKPLSSLGGENDGVILSNIGSMYNKGIEIEIKGDVINKKDLFLQLGGNITFIDNKITKLVPSPEYPNGAPIIRGETILQVGEEYGTFYQVQWAGVNPANGEPMFYDADGNVTAVYNSDARKVLSGKSPIAKFDGSFNIYAKYKGFDFSTNLYFKVGHYIKNYMESNMLSDGTGIDANQRLDAFNYWRNPGDTNVLPNPLYGNAAQQDSDRFIQKGDYLRLRTLSFGYNLPKKFTDILKIQTLRIYISAQNLWTYAPYYKGDPEIGVGSGETTNSDGFGTYSLYSYPQTQSAAVGLNLKF